jgi:hypothetical protein
MLDVSLLGVVLSCYEIFKFTIFSFLAKITLLLHFVGKKFTENI